MNHVRDCIVLFTIATDTHTSNFVFADEQNKSQNHAKTRHHASYHTIFVVEYAP
jgi:hypothetical protein